MAKETPAEKLERKQLEAEGRQRPGKRPKDHLPKKQEPDTEGFVKVSYAGGKFRVDANLDPAGDFELMDMLGSVERGTAYGLGDVLRRVLHQDDYQELLETVRGENGKIRVEDLAGFIPVAFEAVGLGNS